jgi:predicted nucleic acid-binding protein
MAIDQLLLGQYVTFFSSADVSVLSVTPVICDRAAQVGAEYGFGPMDSLHLAAAVEHRCTLFLTADAPLKRFPDIPVEVLS